MVRICMITEVLLAEKYLNLIAALTVEDIPVIFQNQKNPFIVVRNTRHYHRQLSPIPKLRMFFSYLRKLYHRNERWYRIYFYFLIASVSRKSDNRYYFWSIFRA